MTKVPERKLSHGEIIDKLKKNYKYRMRLKEQEAYMESKKKRKQQAERHEYSYEEVIEKLENADGV